MEKNQKNITPSNTQAPQKNEHEAVSTTQISGTADVLYQRLGDKWYAFSIIGDEVYVGAIDEDEVSRIRQERANVQDS